MYHNILKNIYINQHRTISLMIKMPISKEKKSDSILQFQMQTKILNHISVKKSKFYNQSKPSKITLNTLFNQQTINP